MTVEAPQRRHMTVMFCDLVGSTSLAEDLDVEDYREVMGEFRAACAVPIERCGGRIASYMGDGILVHFGYPHAHEDDPQRAVHAGLGILEALDRLNADLERRLGITLHCRIGIHSGLVVAGDLAAGTTREELAIIGPTPNLAARLQSVAEPDSIAISDATQRLIAGYFDVEERGTIPMKGVSRRVVVSRVVRATGSVNRLDAAPTRLTPLIGREHELGTLLERWALAQAGQGNVVHIRAPAGLGKSRLARALDDRLAGAGHSTHVWECVAYRQHSALYPVVRFLETWIGLDRGAPPDEQLEALGVAIASTDLDPDEALPLLAGVLSIEGAPVRTIEPLAARAAAFDVIEALVVADPAQHPLLFVVEDLHWASPTTLDLLSRLVSSIGELPVLAVFTFRPEFAAPWADRGDVLELDVGALGDDDVKRMIDAARGDLRIPERVVDRVVELADGVPLFVDEMVNMLGADSGERPGGPGSTGLTVPDTLQGVLTARLDRLRDVRGVIQLAAVLGRQFPLELLRALQPVAADDVAAAIDRLVAEEILESLPAARYQFRHALLHEAAYGSLPRRERQRHHLAVAEVLTTRFADLAEREPEVVARHYTEADVPAEAVAHWRLAGAQALRTAAFREAASHFRRALDALDAVPAGPDTERQRAFLASSLAASTQAGLGYAAEGVAELYAEARLLATRFDDGELVLSVIRGLQFFRLLRAEYDEAIALAEEMSEIGQRTGDRAATVDGNLQLGLTHLFRGDLGAARVHLERAIDLYRPLDEGRPTFSTLGDAGVGAMAYLATLLFRVGEVDESMRVSDESVRLAEELGLPMSIAQAGGMRAMLHLARREPDLMAEWAQRTAAYAEDRNITYWGLLSQLLASWWQARASGRDEDVARYADTFERYIASGTRLGLPDGSMLLADLRLAHGDVAGAIAALDRATQHVATTGERSVETDLLRAQAEALLAGDPPDVAAAEHALQRSVEVAAAQGARIPQLRSLIVLARLRQRTGGPLAPLRAALEGLCSTFAPDDAFPDVVAARRLLAHLGEVTSR